MVFSESQDIGKTTANKLNYPSYALATLYFKIRNCTGPSQHHDDAIYHSKSVRQLIGNMMKVIRPIGLEGSITMLRGLIALVFTVLTLRKHV